MAMAVSSVLASLDQRISMQMESFEGRDRHEYRSTQVSSNVKTKTKILQKTVSAWNKIFKIFSARAHTIKRKTQLLTIMKSKATPPRVHKLIMCETPNTPTGDATGSPESTQQQQDSNNPNPNSASDENSSQESQPSQRQPPTMNTLNLKTNETFGDTLQLPKPKYISRFLSLNINGFRRANNFQDALETAKALKVTSVDFWNFQETNLDWRSPCLAQCYEKFRKVFHHTRISTSSSSVKYRTLYQPGGTMSAVSDDYVGRVIETGSDRDMGRWSYTRLLGKHGRIIVVVSVYQVCKQNANTVGDRTAFAQQLSLLRRNGKDCSPQKSFFDDLDKQLEEWTQNGYEILLSGDINEELGADVTGFARLSARWNLVEIIQHFHGVDNEPPTYARGTKRLDYVFCTPNLLPSVTKCGILPYSEVLDSDHRALYVDFNTKTFMGGDLASLSATPVRILRSIDTKGREQYVEHVAKYLDDHRVLQRLMQANEASEPDDDRIAAIDRDISRAMAYAIKRIRKVYASPFSPQIKQARLRRQFYKLHLSIHVNKLDLHRQLQTLELELDQVLPVPANIEEAKQLLRDAQKNVQKITTKAAAQRLTHLEEQAIQLDDVDKDKAAQIRKRIIKAEAVKTMYMKLRRYLNPQGHSSLHHVMIPDDNLPPKLAQLWRSIYDPVVLEALILERNKQHFSQAKGTPFTQGILGAIPFSGTGPIADSILAGTLTVDDPIVQLVLDNLKKPPGMTEIPATITLNDVTGKFENWKESTSTSPMTQQHLGHYQSLTRLVKLEEDADRPNPAIARAKKILQAHFLIISTAVKFGISLTRWQNVVNSMIEKEPGKPKIHRLRVIHLYEADYNLTLGIFWARKLVPTAEKQRLFNASCYGSRPGLSAIDPVFLEELQVSVSYLSRTNQVTFHNDATSCYDRIIIALANLVARRFGLPEEIARLHGATLQEMKYYVSTAMGISENHYTHSTESPVYGTGQGSCASPSVWLQICSILFDCHNQKSYGANYSSPDGNLQFKTSMTGFVDDTKGQTNDMGPTPMPLAQLISRMQSDAQLWGDLLHVTGGALEIPKCNYYVMEWKFKPCGSPELNRDVNTVLHIDNGDRSARVTLTNDAIFVAHKTLGTWKSAARDQVKQAAVLEDKSNEYGRTIMASPLTQVDNWQSSHSIYLPRMTYVLPTSYLPAKCLHKIKQRAVAAILCKGGFGSKFSRAVANGPQLYGGIAMRPLQFEQLVEQVKTVLKHLRCPGKGNDMLLITLAWSQLGTGMGFSLLEYPEKSVPHLDCEWLQSLRTGLSSINARIEIYKPGVYAPRRVNDSHIMDAICASKNFTDPEVRRINACRLFLQVTLVSDITTPCGKRIIKNYYKGDITSRINWPTVQYPRQDRPDKKSWTLWRRGLHLIYLHADKHMLKTPLGNWHIAETYHHKWRWNYGQDALYCLSQDGEHQGYCEQSFARRHFQFSKEGVEVTGTPPDSFPVEISESSTHFKVSYKQIFPFPYRREPNQPETIKHRLQQLPESISHLVNNVELLVSEETIEQCLTRQEPLYIASDGGAIPGRASFGWIIQLGSTKIARCKGPTYGDDPRSFRAEGYGMASALVFTSLLYQQFKFTRHKDSVNKLICDNEGLLIRIEESSKWNYLTPNVTLRAEWDVESVILQYYKELGIPFTFKHVKSHQDDTIDVRNLTLESRLNAEADRLATAYMVEDKQRRPKVNLFPSAHAQLIIDDSSVTRKIPQAIRFAAGSIEIRKYLMKRNKWTQHTLDDINWEAHGASHSYHRPQRCYLIKLCHRHLPVGQTLHRRNAKYPPTCPGCRSELETQQHYIQCSAPSRLEWRLKLLTALRNQMETLQTNTNLQESIAHCIDSALSDRAITVSGPFYKALEAQSKIGWVSMLRGHWSKEWQQAYEQSYQSPSEETRKERNRRHLTMARWQKKIIQSTWGFMSQLWTLRNDERHGIDKATRDSARREVLHKELEELYNRKDEYPLRVQQLLRTSYEIHIQETVTKIADWLDAYKGTFTVTWSPD